MVQPMKISYGFVGSIHWINLPMTFLTVILQRAPVAAVVEFSGEILAVSPIGALLKLAAVVAGSMGAMHTLAGATMIVASPQGPLGAAVGVAVTPGVVFSVLGTQYPPSSWSVDFIPPGMNFQGHTIPGTYNVVSQYGTAVLSGTPTVAGTFTLNLVAFEYNNGTGISTPPFSYTVTVTGAGSPLPPPARPPALGCCG